MKPNEGPLRNKPLRQDKELWAWHKRRNTFTYRQTLFRWALYRFIITIKWAIFRRKRETHLCA